MTSHEVAVLTADVVLFAFAEHAELCVLLIRRRKDPHAGLWALPGGKVDQGEDTAAALAAGAITGYRWRLVVDALAAGAGVGEVADALSLDAAEVSAGLRSWARGQLRWDLISQEQHDRVLALLDDEPGEGESDE